MQAAVCVGSSSTSRYTSNFAAPVEVSFGFISQPAGNSLPIERNEKKD